LSVVRNLADERLLIEAAQQDPSRFAELYEKNFHRVYAFVARRVRDRDEAEDVTAEVFHEALRSLGRFQWRGAPFAAWLLRIAANSSPAGKMVTLSSFRSKWKWTFASTRTVRAVVSCKATHPLPPMSGS
jgi:hypothetical protein